MRRFTFLFFLTLLSSLMWTSVNAQQYCVVAGGDTQNDNITNVTFAGINNTTTTHPGYNDFTGLVAQVAQGEQQQLSVTINAFFEGNDYIYAFIDWNGNGTLDDAGEVYTLATYTSSIGPHALNVTVPNDAVSGNIRMRIIVAYIRPIPDPCMNLNYGEVEDYTVSIISPLAACPTGDFTFYSQAEIDAFGTTYGHCTEIPGNVLIQGGDITNLDGLSALESIGGNLIIRNNSQLTNVNGLSALESIGGNLIIRNNSQLTNVNGLSSLTSVGGNLNIDDNSALENLDGLSALESIGGYFQIYNNSVLVSLSGLSALTNVGGSLNIDVNSTLENLDGLSSLTNVGGNLEVWDNSALENLDGLSALTNVGGYLQIYNNSVLASLGGLSSLGSIGDGLYIESNVALTDISGLANINPDTIGGDLYIADNPLLSVCNLSNFCTYLAGDGERTISGNLGTCYDVDAVVTACTPLAACPTGDFTFTTQAEIDAFGATYGHCTEIPGNVLIQGADITNLAGLSALTNIGGFLNIQSNSVLENLYGLSSLENIGGYLQIYNNSVLASLSSLSALTSIGGYLAIYTNATLTDISGLANIDSTTIGGGYGLHIVNNENLEVCILPNFCTYLAGSGPRIISGNLGTCYDVNAVVATCNASVDCPDLEANIGDACTDADGDEGTVDEDCNCYVEPTPPVGDACEWTVHIWDNHWGDEVTWSLVDEDGNVLLHGGDYSDGYDHTQTVTTEGPLTFTISNNGTFGDNKPNYTVSNGTEILVEGQLIPFAPTNQVFTDLNCDGVTPPLDWDCPDLEANFGDVCTNADGNEGTVDEDCNCYVIPICSAEWTGVVSEDWNTAANWCDNTVPTAGSNVVINNSNLAIIDINTVVTIESITLGAAANVTVNGLLNVGDITVAAGGSLVIANDANLLQSETATNTGNITVKRNTVIKHLDYTIWSSPVAGQELEAFSPNTLASRIYQYNTSTDAWEVTAGNFTAGKGIMFRAPNLFDDGNYPNAYTYEGVFTGTPHNGDISVSFSQVGEYQGVGNPYPSNIKITGTDGFWNANPTVGTLYFWTNTNAWNTGTGDYVANNWATYSNLGGLAAANGTKVPIDVVSVGQGFVIETPGLSSVSFNNGMRTVQNSVFFRTIEEDKHRIWLNLSDSSSELNNILIGYMDGATQGEDLRIDSKMLNYNGSALYSLIESNGFAYTIQGRSLPFDDFDVVPLGFRATTSGAFTVSLSNFDGVFAQGQDIFLKDNLTQTQHNLKDSDYTFVSNQGEFTTRFEVVYRTSMDVTNPELSNAWAVYAKDKTFFIETQVIDLKEVMVYDMLGRVIYESQAQGNKHSFAQIGANQVLVIKVITTDNKVLTKKVSN